MPNTSPNRSKSAVEISFDDHYLAFLTKEDGSPDMAVDGSVTPVVFDCVIPDLNGRALIITTLVVHMLSADLSDPNDFAGIVGGVTNGLTGQVIHANGFKLSLFVEPIKQDFQFLHHTVSGGFDMNLIPGAASPDYASFTFNYAAAGFRLILNKGDSISMAVRDDLSAVSDMRVALHGYWRGS